MSQVRVHNFSVSLGTRLHEWFFPTRSFRAMQSQPGGSTGIDDAFASAWAPGIGAEIMGRGKFGRTTDPGRTRSGTDGGETTRRSAPRSLFSPTIPGPPSR